MLGSVGSIVPKRWILGIFALGLIAVMVATSASPWAGAATLPTSVTATAVTSTSIQVDWTAAEAGSTVPGSTAATLSGLVDAYTVDCVGTPGTVSVTVAGISTATATVTGLTANTAYVCSVFTSSTGTIPASGVAASSVTTPASAAATLGSAFVNLPTANVQVGGTLNLGVVAEGADSGSTVITTGVTVVWSSTANGSVSPTTGT
ncbi:MAG: fibronectin type III domain-containing protein, partial [Dehalococcoidia bacterium]|nr:fibronectin type III domain-containing protein [Dehalococcoidia bacterium]